MIKRFIPIFLGFSLMFSSVTQSNLPNTKNVIESKAEDAAYEDSFVKTDFSNLSDGDIGLIVNGPEFRI